MCNGPGIKLLMRLKHTWLIQKARECGLSETGTKRMLAGRIAKYESEKEQEAWDTIAGRYGCGTHDTEIQTGLTPDECLKKVEEIAEQYLDIVIEKVTRKKDRSIKIDVLIHSERKEG